jgi:MtN3 and saliva related transmembrane protein
MLLTSHATTLLFSLSHDASYRESFIVIMNPVVLGLVAGAFTSFASLPQIIYVIRTRSMKDISLTTLGMYVFGVALWLVYGISIHAVPVIMWNAISLSLYLVQITLKLAITGSFSAVLARVGRRDLATMMRAEAVLP